QVKLLIIRIPSNLICYKPSVTGRSVYPNGFIGADSECLPDRGFRTRPADSNHRYRPVTALSKRHGLGECNLVIRVDDILETCGLEFSVVSRKGDFRRRVRHLANAY